MSTAASVSPEGLPADLEIDLAIESDGWPDVVALQALTRRAVDAAFRIAGLKTAPHSELSLVFLDDTGIRELNNTWRDKDKPTNVLSFPGGEPEGDVYGPLLGDIVFALETVKLEAEELGIPFNDHFTHLVVHGTLHLFGYDHQIDAEAEVMEGLERRILEHLGIADPYADVPLAADAE